MTREEAIKCLTLEISIRAEAYRSYLAHYGKQDHGEEDFLDALYSELDALREQEKRSKAESERRVVVLPCKVDDTVYVINRHINRVFECTVLSFSVGRNSDLKNYFKTRWVGPKGNESVRKWTLRQFGRYVFATREEAEEALRRMEDA